MPRTRRPTPEVSRSTGSRCRGSVHSASSGRHKNMATTGVRQRLLGVVRPTTRECFSTARNVVNFANQDGTYDDLAAYIKAHKL